MNENNIIQDKTKLLKAIESIENRGKRLDSDIQKALVSAMWHRNKHGDNTFLSMTLEAMPMGSRRKAAVLYVLEFGAVELDDKAEKGKVKFRNIKGKQADYHGAMKKDWWDYKGQKEDGEFKPDADLKALLKMVENRIKKAKTSGNNDYAGKLEAAYDILKA